MYHVSFYSRIQEDKKKTGSSTAGRKNLVNGVIVLSMRFAILIVCSCNLYATGEYTLCKETIAKIPEIYFTKLQLDAILFEGEYMFESPCEQKHQSAEMLLDMILRLADYYESKSNTPRAKAELMLALHIARAMENDQATSFHEKTFHEYCRKEVQAIVTQRLNNL